MKKAIILCTRWKVFFEKENIAPYDGFDSSKLQGWDEFIKQGIIPALGVYTKEFNEECFVYIKVLGLSKDNSGFPRFDFKVIEKSNTPSFKLLNLLENKFLFSSISQNEIMSKLKQINENPPSEWVNLFEKEIKITEDTSETNNIEWLAYIGEYYKRLFNRNISNNEFEDIVAKLLIALGFDVEQAGHNVVGAKPDGVATHNEYSLVYDCKNSDNFYLNEEERRKMDNYIKDENIIRKKHELFPLFIARGYNNSMKANYNFLTVENLIYLLYKKLTFGFKFSLERLFRIIKRGKELSKDSIDIEFRI